MSSDRYQQLTGTPPGRFLQSRLGLPEATPLRRYTPGRPLLDGTAAQFECRTEARHYSGDHVIFIGHVLHYSYADRAPLGYFRGAYAAIQAVSQNS